MSKAPSNTPPKPSSVRTRLLDAALKCFLADEYHRVTTRLIADQADANASMIRYYFGSKEGLYEEMIRKTLTPLLEVLDSQQMTSANGFIDFLHLYYTTMADKPEFPKLILKVLALNHGPGKRFIQQLLERGRSQGAKTIEHLKENGLLPTTINADILRIAFISLAMTPMLLKEIFENQLGHRMDQRFLNDLAQFNGGLFGAGLDSINNET